MIRTLLAGVLAVALASGLAFAHDDKKAGGASAKDAGHKKADEKKADDKKDSHTKGGHGHDKKH